VKPNLIEGPEVEFWDNLGNLNSQTRLFIACLGMRTNQ
jgi:hypothetical protein